MKKNNMGYMLIEIILAFVLAFGIIFFITELVINLKNRNDDILVLSKVKTEQAIIYNKLNRLLQEKGKDFDCNSLYISNNNIKYNDTLIVSVDENVLLNKNNLCEITEVNDIPTIKINISFNILQMPDEKIDVNIVYGNIPKINLTCEDIISCNDSSKDSYYKLNYSGDCEVIENEDYCKIKFLNSGTLELSNALEVDIFLVGGGGGGGNPNGNGPASGGGGGYTTTAKNIFLNSNAYQITIGNGGKSGFYWTATNPYTIIKPTSGGVTSAFGYTANGGFPGGANTVGGAGGNVGGSVSGNPPGSCSDSTREFGETTGVCYAGGGGTSLLSGGSILGGEGGGGNPAGCGGPATPGEPNTGGGGGSGHWACSVKGGAAGGSGVVIIRVEK